MTTGRINQVTDDRPRRARPDAVETPSSPRPPVGTPHCWEQPRRVAEPNQRKIFHRQSHGHRPTVPTIGASRPTERPTDKNLEGNSPSGGPRNKYRPHSTNNTPGMCPRLTPKTTRPPLDPRKAVPFRQLANTGCGDRPFARSIKIPKLPGEACRRIRPTTPRNRRTAEPPPRRESGDHSN